MAKDNYKLIKNQRCAKIQTANYPTKEKNKGDRKVPWLNLKGDWLCAAGFEVDTPIKIRVMDGCLVLTVEG